MYLVGALPIRRERSSWEIEHGRAVDVGGCIYLGRNNRSLQERDQTFFNYDFLNYLGWKVDSHSRYSERKWNGTTGPQPVDFEELFGYTTSGTPVLSAYRGLIKYSWAHQGNGNEGIDPQLLRHLPGAVSMLHECFDPVVKGARVLSYEESILAAGGSTGPGFPWSFMGYKTRDDCIEDPEYHCLMTGEYLPRVQSGVPVTPRFSGSSKEEVRAVEKVIKGDTRFYMGGPQEFHHWCLMLFKNLCDLLHSKARFVSPMMIGLRKQKEWGMLRERLNAHPNELYFDFKNMDSSVRRVFLEVVYRWRAEILEQTGGAEAYKWVMTCFEQTITRSVAMPDSYEYLVFGGVSSGSLLTSDDDTMVTILLWFMFWKSVAPESGWGEFKQNVELLVYGDDVAMSFSDEVKGLFTVPAILRFFDGVGMTLKVEAPQFLSQNFVEVGGVVVPTPVKPYRRLAGLVVSSRRMTRRGWYDVGTGLLQDSYWDLWLRNVFTGWLMSYGPRIDIAWAVPTSGFFLELYGVPYEVTTSYGLSNHHVSVLKGRSAGTMTKNRKSLAKVALATAAAAKDERKLVKEEKKIAKAENKIRGRAQTQGIVDDIGNILYPGALYDGITGGTDYMNDRWRAGARGGLFEPNRPPNAKSGVTVGVLAGGGAKAGKKKEKSVVLKKVSGYEKVLETNALAYFLGQSNPSIPDIRIPDGTRQPSLTSQFVQRITVPRITAGTDTVVGLVLYPNLKDGIWTASTASTSKNNVVWSYTDFSELGSGSSGLSGIAAMYRVVSMGFKVIDIGPIMNRGMNMLCGNLPSYGYFNTPADIIGYTANTPMKQMDSASCANGCHMFWVPQADTLSAGFVQTGAITAFGGQSWRAPGLGLITADTNHQFADTGLVMFNWGFASDGSTDQWTVEVFMNIEYLPLPASRFIGTPELTYGSVDSMEKIKMSMAPDVPSEGYGVKETPFVDSLSAAANEVLGMSMPLVQKGVKAFDYISPFLAGLLGSEGKVIDKMHQLSHAAGKPDLSPIPCCLLEEFPVRLRKMVLNPPWLLGAKWDADAVGAFMGFLSQEGDVLQTNQWHPSVPQQVHKSQIWLTLEEYASLRSLDGKDMKGLDDIRYCLRILSQKEKCVHFRKDAPDCKSDDDSDDDQQGLETGTVIVTTSGEAPKRSKSSPPVLKRVPTASA